MPRLLNVLLLLCAFSAAQAQGTRAFLDREQIVLGETVTLNIETDQLGAGEPDLSALGDDLRVVGSSSSTELSLINGRQSSRTLWGVVLEPQQAGLISIPALEVRGQRTQALRLSVLPPSAAPATPDGDLVLEVEAAPENPYVQQQLIYTVRLLYAVTLLDGQLDEPRAQGADIRRLGGDATFTRDAGGRRYNVIERRYAVTPLASGPLTIEPPRFRGRALAGPRGNRMFDPGTPVSATGRPLQIDVRPRPAAAAEPWLPALSLDYRANSSAGGELKVGEPITLSLQLAARGLSAEQLPELQLPAIEGAEVYPDQENSQTREGPRGIEGERSRSFAVVPTRAGTLELPRLVLHWWDTAADAPREAVIEAQRFEVQAAAGAPDTVAPAPEQDTRTAPASAAGVHPLWRWAALLQLPLLGLLGVLLWRRRLPTTAQASPAFVPPPPQADPALGAALRGGELAPIADALRAVARGRGLPPDLDALRAALDDAAQAEAIAALQRALYAGESEQPALQTLRVAFARAPTFRPHAAPVAAALPPLYPSRSATSATPST